MKVRGKFILLSSVLVGVCLLFRFFIFPTKDLTEKQGQPLSPKVLTPPVGMTLCKFDEKYCDKPYKLIKAYVTAYNTLLLQTDSNPCISADGTNICGRSDVVACPRKYKFGTKINILGRDYVCHDRMALRFDKRFDISFDKDYQGAINFGIKYLEIKVYE